MAAAAEEPMSIECGYCHVKGEDLQDPRVLPCSHIFCRGCLAGQLEKHKVVSCPTCSKEFDVEVDNLPTHKPTGFKEKCDACAKKGNDDHAAVMYCKTCTKKHCVKHQESHDDLLPDHITIPIAEYEVQASKLETRNCTEHKEQVCSLGCAVCLTAFCNSCISPTSICANGKPHELQNLEGLASKLSDTMDKQKEAMVRKEEKLSALLKQSSKTISDYQKETKGMVEKLHQTRDRQIEAIQAKYKGLEDELLMQRNNAQEEIQMFMEKQVGAALTILSNQRTVNEMKLGKRHQVDIVNAFRETQTVSAKLLEGDVPVLALDDVKTLVVSDERREVEAEIVTANSIYIGCEPGLVLRGAPKTLSLQKNVKTGSFCHSVCHYKGCTFLGSNNQTINVVGRDGKLKKFASKQGQGFPHDISIYGNKMFVLCSGQNGPYTINVYDLSGKIVDQWNRIDSCQYTGLAIVPNKIVVPDYKGQQLTLYTFSGEVVQHIPCPLLSSSSVVDLLFQNSSAICLVGDDSVIVTSYRNSLVFRVDITSGRTVWSSNDVTNPQAAAMYGVFLVCVVSEKKISFLNVNTGNATAETVAPALSREVQLLRPGSYMNIDIVDNTLIVSTCHGLLYYKLNK